MLVAAVLAATARGDQAFINFETAPIHPVALAPDGRTLAVCNLPDGRVELFEVSTGIPRSVGSVPVGVDPVSVRFRTTNELWIVNHISRSISIVDIAAQRVVATLDTLGGPADVVFAGSPARVFVSCAKDDVVQIFDPITRVALTNVPIAGNRPKAMAVSPNGAKVYVAIFESGNASTIVAGREPEPGFGRVSLLADPRGPYGGQVPPPNVGTNLVPALYREPDVNPGLYSVFLPDSIIVKRNREGLWIDDNSGDWTQFISGTNAAMTGRAVGWDMPDRDLAIIDTATLDITYATGLMNICMNLAVNPASGAVAVIGTDATNERRFEPHLRGRFVRVNLALVNPSTLGKTVLDLNPHLDYSTSNVPHAVRDLSIGDPRGIVWNSAGTRGYVTGMGSRNLIVIDADGHRATPQPIELGEGPTGLALDEERQRLYVLNRFSSTLSALDTATLTVVTSVALFDPTPPAIKTGRKHLYDTRRNSGLGQVACGSCHVDARFDRLAWDLSDPTSRTYIPDFFPFQNPAYFHPLKGPLVTQTLQDIIGSEPLHWRGDRQSLQNFDGTFTNLLGADTVPTTNDMTEFKAFLSTIVFPPNRARNFDNSIQTNFPLPGFYGRNSATGTPDEMPLPNGNPLRGAVLFATKNSRGLSCAECHNERSGLGTDGETVLAMDRASIGPLKAAQLRNVGDKLGFDLSGTNSRAGFGLRFDGRVDTLTRFLFTLFEDQFRTNQDLADVTAFVLSSFPRDSHAALGRQITLSMPGSNTIVNAMIAVADPQTNHVELVAHGMKDGVNRSWFYDPIIARFQSDRNDETIAADDLLALAGPGEELTFTVVAEGTGHRLGNDRDGDGTFDRTELDLGFDPADRFSNSGNAPPRLPVRTNIAVHPGMPISIPFTATDPNWPAQTLRYRLTRETPSGATLDPTNGVFNWIPTLDQGDRIYRIGVEVSDDGTPALYDRALIAVNVAILRATFVSLHVDTRVHFRALSGHRYQLLFKNRLEETAWTDGEIRTAEEGSFAPPLVGSGFLVDQDNYNHTNSPQRFYRILRLE